MECIESGCSEPRIRFPSGAKTRCHDHYHAYTNANKKRLYRADHEAWRVRTREQGREWSAANRERKRELNRQSTARDPERVHAVRKAWEAKNRTAYNAQQNANTKHRRIRKSGIALIVTVTADHCGVCLGPLVPSARWPEPMATTVGHEPPLVAAVRTGWRIVVERPEHFACNLAKRDRTDAELAR